MFALREAAAPFGATQLYMWRGYELQAAQRKLLPILADTAAVAEDVRLREQIIGGRCFAYTGKPGALDAWEQHMRETGPVDGGER